MTKPAAPPTAQALASATAPANAVSPTSPAATQAVAAATQPAATVAAPTRPPTGGDLNTTEMLAIMSASFGTYPHRIRQTVVSKANNQTSTGVTEATDLDHIHLTSNIATDQGNVLLESILISPTLYVKPPNEKWRLANPDEADMIGLLILGADPSLPLKAIPVTDPNKKVYLAIGDEVLNGIATTHYRQEFGDKAAGTRYVSQLWIGTGEKRIFQLSSDGPLDISTSVIGYDPTIKVMAPIP